MEICVHTLKMSQYSDRGFLFGPYCPIYGFGVLILKALIGGFTSNPALTFVLSSAICTTFELLVGLAMRKIFRNIWWDYSDEKFNFKGLICLKVSIEWGVVGTLGMCVLVPATESLIKVIPVTLGHIAIFLWGAVMLADTVSSVVAVKKLNVNLKHISEMTDALGESASDLGRNIGETALEAQENATELYADAYLAADDLAEQARSGFDEIADNINEKLAEANAHMQRRADLYAAFTDFRIKRIIKAYPGFKSIDYEEALENVKEFLSN